MTVTAHGVYDVAQVLPYLLRGLHNLSHCLSVFLNFIFNVLCRAQPYQPKQSRRCFQVYHCPILNLGIGIVEGAGFFWSIYLCTEHVF